MSGESSQENSKNLNRLVKLPLRIVRRLRAEYRFRKKIINPIRYEGAESLFIEDINSAETVRRFGKLSPDVVFCAAYPQILSKAVLDVPRIGCVNFHPSLLPKYRGAHPHFWCIAQGEEISGVTAHYMTQNIDDGPIIAQRRFSIKDMCYHELYDKIVSETPALVRDVEDFFSDPASTARRQCESEATCFRNDRKVHHRIFWGLHTAEYVYNLVRTGKAFCFFRDGKVRILSADPSYSNRNMTNKVVVEPGTIVDLRDDAIVAKTRNGYLNVSQLRQNNKDFTAIEWRRKNEPTIGEKFQ